MNSYALVAAALTKITKTKVITYDEYLLQKDSNRVNYQMFGSNSQCLQPNYQIFDCKSLHKMYLVKGDVASNKIGVKGDIFTNKILSSNNIEMENPAKKIENLFVTKFLGKTLTIKNLNENFTVNQLKNKIYETEGIPPDDQCLFIGNIFIRNLSGDTITIKNINANTSISQLKNKIYETQGIPPDQQCLSYALKTLQDHQTLSHYEITNDTTIHLTIRVLGGTNTIHVLDPDFLDPSYDFDFTNMKCSGYTYMRGNYKYNRPYGWNRIALKVLDKFPDNDWLGVKNRQSLLDSVDGEWIVSYHGTKKNYANSIAKNGFLLNKGKHFYYGVGIYSTPDINIAADYAEDFKYGRVNYQIVFQNRVNPNTLVKAAKPETGIGDYYITPNDRDIRPYGLCIRKL